MEYNKNKNKIMARNQVSVEYQWDVESLYKNDDEWKADCSKIYTLLDKLLLLKDSFTQKPSILLKCFKLKDSILELMQKIYVFAHMKKDEDNGNDLYQSFFYQASNIFVKIDKELSFIEPGILSLEENIIKSWLQEYNELEIYRHYLESIYRKKEHIFTPDIEKIIAQTGDMANIFEYSFELLSYADLRFPKIKDENNVLIPITHSSFTTLLRNNNRNIREKTYKNFYKVYENLSNIYATLLAGNLKKDHFYSSVRNYNDSLEAALFKNNIPKNVYTNLIEYTHKNINLLHKYMELKAEFMGLEKINMYDMYAPLVEGSLIINYHEAQNIVLESIKPLGETYLRIVKKAFEERWIDVYENKGKTSGAYSSGTYGSKPFILMNYQNTLDDVFTLAHELGHSVHSYLINETQPFIYSDVSIFLAEIASTTNEVLLTHYLLDKVETKKEKAAILLHFLEQYRTTFFRQTMFAEYEYLIHQAQERGEAITADFLKKKYTDLNHFYHGENVVLDKEIGMEWARIPHFYYNYYVYQYATGFAIATAISQEILEKKELAAKKYIDFLKSGSSDYPIPILKIVDIDPTSLDYLDNSLKLFARLLNQFSELQNSI